MVLLIPKDVATSLQVPSNCSWRGYRRGKRPATKNRARVALARCTCFTTIQDRSKAPADDGNGLGASKVPGDPVDYDILV